MCLTAGWFALLRHFIPCAIRLQTFFLLAKEAIYLSDKSHKLVRVLLDDGLLAQLLPPFDVHSGHSCRKRGGCCLYFVAAKPRMCPSSYMVRPAPRRYSVTNDRYKKLGDNRAAC
jgi:hypothetical protein